jgi:sensor histidine kinase YesM
LFNSLNCIARLALFEGAPKSVKMTELLANYLRYTLENQPEGSVTELREELRCIDYYLEIYKTRFGDRISISVNITPELLGNQMPYMILQPLVENALIHGLEPSLRNGAICLTATQDGDSVRITIEDNGAGFDTNSVKEGIGLENVRKRLELHYNGAAKLDIVSVPDEGTRVTMIIPQKPVVL